MVPRRGPGLAAPPLPAQCSMLVLPAVLPARLAVRDVTVYMTAGPIVFLV